MWLVDPETGFLDGERTKLSTFRIIPHICHFQVEHGKENSWQELNTSIEVSVHEASHHVQFHRSSSCIGRRMLCVKKTEHLNISKFDPQGRQTWCCSAAEYLTFQGSVSGMF